MTDPPRLRIDERGVAVPAELPSAEPSGWVPRLAPPEGRGPARPAVGRSPAAGRSRPARRDDEIAIHGYRRTTGRRPVAQRVGLAELLVAGFVGTAVLTGASLVGPPSARARPAIYVLPHSRAPKPITIRVVGR